MKEPTLFDPEPAPIEPVPDLKALGLSLVRTFVPLIVGAILSLGIEFDSATLTLFVSGLITVVYYFVVRLLEVYVAPKLGWLLGAPRSPQYAPASFYEKPVPYAEHLVECPPDD